MCIMEIIIPEMVYKPELHSPRAGVACAGPRGDRLGLKANYTIQSHPPPPTSYYSFFYYISGVLLEVDALGDSLGRKLKILRMGTVRRLRRDG